MLASSCLCPGRTHTHTPLHTLDHLNHVSIIIITLPGFRMAIEGSCFYAEATDDHFKKKRERGAPGCFLLAWMLQYSYLMGSEVCSLTNDPWLIMRDACDAHTHTYTPNIIPSPCTHVPTLYLRPVQILPGRTSHTHSLSLSHTHTHQSYVIKQATLTFCWWRMISDTPPGSEVN